MVAAGGGATTWSSVCPVLIKVAEVPWIETLARDDVMGSCTDVVSDLENRLRWRRVVE